MGLCLLGFSVGQEMYADINAALGPSAADFGRIRLVFGLCLAVDG